MAETHEAVYVRGKVLLEPFHILGQKRAKTLGVMPRIFDQAKFLICSRLARSAQKRPFSTSGCNLGFMLPRSVRTEASRMMT